MMVQYALRFLDKRFYIALQSGIIVEISLQNLESSCREARRRKGLYPGTRAGSFRLSLIYRDVSCPPQLPRQALCVLLLLFSIMRRRRRRRPPGSLSRYLCAILNYSVLSSHDSIVRVCLHRALIRHAAAG